MIVTSSTYIDMEAQLLTSWTKLSKELFHGTWLKHATSWLWIRLAARARRKRDWHRFYVGEGQGGSVLLPTDPALNSSKNSHTFSSSVYPEGNNLSFTKKRSYTIICNKKFKCFIKIYFFIYLGLLFETFVTFMIFFEKKIVPNFFPRVKTRFLLFNMFFGSP